MHLIRRDQCFILFPVRFETDPPVEKYFHIRPNVGQVFPSGLLQYRFDQNQHPGWNAGKTVDILIPRAVDDRFYFTFPFVHQDDPLCRNTHQVDQRTQVLQ